MLDVKVCSNLNFCILITKSIVELLPFVAFTTFFVERQNKSGSICKYKPGGFNSYRPISILPYFSNLIETIAHRRYFDKLHLLNDFQFVSQNIVEFSTALLFRAHICDKERNKFELQIKTLLLNNKTIWDFPNFF